MHPLPPHRGRRLSILLASLLMTAAVLTAGAGTPSDRVSPALKNAPGYYPPADPESMSVVVGRRVDAPLVSMKFAGGAKSMDELGRMICHALHHSSRDSLQALCVTREEFSVILWPEFPQSRPITGITADQAWMNLNAQHQGALARGLGDWAGQDLTFVRWARRDTVGVYNNFRLHRGLALVAKDEDGREVEVDLVRMAAERKGRFKLYSLKD